MAGLGRKFLGTNQISDDIKQLKQEKDIKDKSKE